MLIQLPLQLPKLFYKLCYVKICFLWNVNVVNQLNIDYYKWKADKQKHEKGNQLAKKGTQSENRRTLDKGIPVWRQPSHMRQTRRSEVFDFQGRCVKNTTAEWWDYLTVLLSHAGLFLFLFAKTKKVKLSFPKPKPKTDHNPMYDPMPIAWNNVKVGIDNRCLKLLAYNW